MATDGVVRTALVTGAGGGIGGATAHVLAGEGYVVTCADVDADAAARTAGAVADAGGRARAVGCDVTRLDACREAVAVAGGEGTLDLLVNVAGVGAFRPTADVTLAEWERTLAVNLTGTFLMCQAAIPSLLEQRGAIVNVASTAALAAHPWAAAYSASKGGVLALTRTLAIEYAKQGLRANAVCPGSIDTPITDAFQLPAGADGKLLYRIMSPTGMGDAARVAAAIAYLGSDDAVHVNGADLRIDGGTHS